MKLLNLRIENFMGLLGEHELALVNRGLIHVAGVNLDDPGNNSNGAGKTTILEALTWCLFGEGLPRPQGNSERGVGADEVLHDALGKQCKVDTMLADEGQNLTVSRWRKYKPAGSKRQSTGVALVRDGVEIETLDEKETNRLICEALGITYDIWCRGVVFGQESGFNFCDATALQRQDILTTVMGLEAVDQWQERCRDEKRALTTKLAEVGGKLEVLRRQDQELADNDSGQRVKEWEADRARRLDAQQAHVGEIADYGKELKVQCDALPPIPELPMAGSFGVPPEVAEPYRAAETEMRAAQHAAHAAERTLRDAEQRLDRTMGTLNQAACPTCGQAITVEHRAACEAAGQEDVRQASNAFLEAGAGSRAAHGRFTQWQQEHEAAARLAAQAREQFNAVRAEHQRLTFERGKLEQQLGQARTDWLSASQRVDLIKAECNPHLVYQAEMEGKIERVAAELAAATADQDEITTALAVCLWWDKELPRFKTWMFDSVVDVLAGEANRWLGIMSGGVIWVQISTQKQVAKRLKDELDINVLRWNPDGSITTRNYRVWSGGEKRRIALAVDLGLSRLMAQRASKAYRFLALDEVDRHLDDRGKDGLRQVLDELRQDKDLVLTVTHDPAFRASFDGEIVVTKDRGQTRMEIRDGRAEARTG